MGTYIRRASARLLCALCTLAIAGSPDATFFMNKKENRKQICVLAHQKATIALTRLSEAIMRVRTFLPNR